MLFAYAENANRLAGFMFAMFTILPQHVSMLSLANEY